MNARTRAGLLAWGFALSATAACDNDSYPYRDDEDPDAAVVVGPDAQPIDAGDPPGGSGSVWLVGTTAEGSFQNVAFQPLHPGFDPDYYLKGYNGYVSRFVFRRTDGQLFYEAAFTGILEDHPNDQHEWDNDVHIETPPCVDNVNANFDFDGAGVLHYRCGGGTTAPLYKGNGEMIHDAVQEIAGVLDDGRIIVTDFGDYVVLGTDGTELSRYTPPAFSEQPDPDATTVQGNQAYLLFTYVETPGDTHHLHVVRFSDTDTWTELGDFVVDDMGYYRVIHPGGRVFVHGDDPDRTFDNQIRSFDFSGKAIVHWLEKDYTIVRVHENVQLVYQP